MNSEILRTPQTLGKRINWLWVTAALLGTIVVGSTFNFAQNLVDTKTAECLYAIEVVNKSNSKHGLTKYDKRLIVEPYCYILVNTDGDLLSKIIAALKNSGKPKILFDEVT